jgi:hypothetical protein
MTETLGQQCIEILKRSDVKHELRAILNPIIEFILYEINPYIYITVSLIFMIFIMMASILILLIIGLKKGAAI